MTCKDMSKVVNVVGNTKGEGWVDYMTNTLHGIPNTHIKALESCCRYLMNQDVDDHIKDSFRKVGDYSKLIEMLVKEKDWLEVGKLCDSHERDTDKSLLLPYADWLSLQARYGEGRTIYQKVEQPDRSRKLLMDLIQCAIVEE